MVRARVPIVALVLLAMLPAPASAQRLAPWAASARLPAPSSAVAQLPDTTIRFERSSTFGERTLFGLLAGVGASLVMLGAYGEDYIPGEVFVSGYALGSALGTELVALPHEGPRPLGAILGAAAGTAVGFLALAPFSCEDCGDPPAGLWFGITMYALAVPMGAALGHGIGEGARGAKPSELFRRAEPGATLRLERSDRSRVTGQMLRMTDSTITLQRWFAVNVHGNVYDTLDVRLDSIGRAWIRTGTDWQRGAIVGAAVGAALGLSALLVDDSGSDISKEQLATAATTLFALSGGVIGGVIGSANSRWQPTAWPPPASPYVPDTPSGSR